MFGKGVYFADVHSIFLCALDLMLNIRCFADDVQGYLDSPSHRYIRLIRSVFSSVGRLLLSPVRPAPFPIISYPKCAPD
jgi:hypothetical protein